MQTEYQGSCHCGAIGFRYWTATPPAEWSIRACQCTFCRAHDALSTSDPAGQIEFFANQPELLQRYRFGLKTADFHLCRQCGVYIGAEIETTRGLFGIVNLHALKEKLSTMAQVAPISYDDEDTRARSLRREVRWSPVIREGDSDPNSVKGQ